MVCASFISYAVVVVVVVAAVVVVVVVAVAVVVVVALRLGRELDGDVPTFEGLK